MEAVKIQNGKLLSIDRFYINGKRVTGAEYTRRIIYATGYNSSSTTRTKAGNFRHTANYNNI